MKNIFRSLLAAALLVIMFAACDKKDSLASYQLGSAVTLTASTNAIAAAPADSSKTGVTFKWTNPGYSQDTSLYKFTIQVDSAGRNFTKAYSKTVTGTFTTSMLNSELNTAALGWGFAFYLPYTLDVRVISSYGNNNEQYTSNIVQIKYTPYKVPPVIALPTTGKLYLVGDATQGGWNNPVPTPSQQFAQLDETTFAGVFNLVGGKNYLVLPLNGNWDHKFSVANSSVPAAGGDFGYDLPSNFNGPATDGWYKIVLDFQHGKYTVTAAALVPDNLYIVGDATAGGWNNPVPTPSQQFTKLNSAEFELSTIPLGGGKQYLFLPLNGNWDHKYGGNDKLGGILLTDGDVPGSNTPSPDVAGNYKINVNFASKTYKLTKL